MVSAGEECVLGVCFFAYNYRMVRPPRGLPRDAHARKNSQTSQGADQTKRSNQPYCGGCTMSFPSGESSSQRPQGQAAVRRAPLLSTLAGFAILVAVAVAAGALLFRALGPALEPLEESQASRAEGHPAVGQRLPVLELEALTDGSQRVTLADLSGKVVLLNFWGTWCPPCRAEIPELAELYHRMAGHPRFAMLPVSCGPAGAQAETLEELKEHTLAFLSSKQLALPAYADPGGTTRAAFRQLGGRSVFPTTVLLDGQGMVRAVWVGYAPGVMEEIERRVVSLLAE